MAPVDRLSSARGSSATRPTHPAAPFALAVVIAVTVLTPAWVVCVPVLVAVGLPAGVELGLKSSRHEEELEPPTVRTADDPPFPNCPLSNAARMKRVPAAMFVFQSIELAEVDWNMNGWPDGIAPRIVTGFVAVLSQ